MALPRAKLTGLLINELAAVDKGAQGKQPTVVLKRAPEAVEKLVGVSLEKPVDPIPVIKAQFERIVKQAVLTDEVDGHQHTIDLDDVTGWYSSLTTSYQTSDGAECGHSHAWVFDKATGAITIASDSGHTHTVEAVVPANLLGLAAAKEASRALDVASATSSIGASVITQAVDAAASGNVSLTVVTQRAHDTNSPPSAALPSVEKHQEPNQMMDAIKIRKALAAALLMPEEHRTHAATLDDDAQVEFIEKSAADRDAIVKAALDSDPVMHTMTDGTTIRKSAGLLTIKLAKQSDEQAVQLEKARVETERVTLTKRAETELGHLAGTVDTKVRLLKAIDRHVTDEKEREEVTKLLKSANAIVKAAGHPNGTTEQGAIETSDPKVALANLEKGLVAYCTAQKITKVWTEGLDAFSNTDEGAALVEAYQAADAQ
jgi:hypothetical protein